MPGLFDGVIGELQKRKQEQKGAEETLPSEGAEAAKGGETTPPASPAGKRIHEHGEDFRKHFGDRKGA